MSNRLKILLPVLVVLFLALTAPFFLYKNGRENSAEKISQKIAAQSTKTDNLRNAMRYLKQMTPMNRAYTESEVRVALNTWMNNLPKEASGFKPSPLLRAIPTEMLAVVGCETPLQFKFSDSDIGFLFGQRLMNSLSRWIVDAPFRDKVVEPILAKEREKYSPEEAFQLEEACKLFDWVIRNVGLSPENADVEQRADSPAPPLQEGGMGYSYMPWEALLFSEGDFVERGRIFMSLAQQRKIDCVWVQVENSLWAIGVAIGDDLLLFEPKLGLPILEPDKEEFASLEDAKENPRVLQRLDISGRFDYAYNPGDIKDVRLLIDAPPTALSLRMKMLEEKLLSDERMVLFQDANELVAKMQKIAPDAEVELALFPIMAQIFALQVRQQLELTTDFKRQYMQKHGMWMMDTPASKGRLNHLYGLHESSAEKRGALSFYMACREDDVSLEQLAYDPEIQQRLGVVRKPGQDPQQFQQELEVASFVYKKAKVDASFLLGALHYDRGNYEGTVSWMKNRVIESDNPLAASWSPSAHYVLGRAYAQVGDLAGASDSLSAESPQEAGNRIRLRYLRRRFE